MKTSLLDLIINRAKDSIEFAYIVYTQLEIEKSNNKFFYLFISENPILVNKNLIFYYYCVIKKTNSFILETKCSFKRH